MVKHKWLPVLLVLAVGFAAVFGCSQGRKVERVDPEEQIDLSGRWNDTDSRFVSVTTRPNSW